jgi:XTP/dITP diphosphohydrolase
MEIVIASGNLHKIREFRDMLKPLKHIEILSLKNFPNYTAPEEDKTTFKDNAILKAEHAAKALNKWVLADDSGLVVPAINGEPGVVSRRYAGDQATDAENRKKLLERMQGLGDEARAAYFECCLALASPAGLKKSVTGTCEGVIIEHERGNHGFGYDSLFVKYDYDKTFGELDENTKNRISHRRKAFEKLALYLEVLRE